MRVGFFGDGPWAHDALEKIQDSNEYSVAFVVARYPNPDPVLKEKSERYCLPFYCVKNVNSPDFVGLVKDKKVDVNVSMSFDQIIRVDLRESADKGFLNCHAGALPFYRGRNVINWALINGEQRLGVTVHYVDDGIDTGDIVNQRFIAIGDDDNYSTILDRAVVQCSEALVEALSLAKRNEIRPRIQNEIHPEGTYFGTRTWGDEWIDWSWDSERIWNFVRAITIPGPGARTIHRDRQIAVLEAALVPARVNYIGKEGQVVGRVKDGVIVKVGDSVVRIKKLHYVKADGNPGEKLERLPRVGESLGRDSNVEIDRLTERLRRLEERLDAVEQS
jgi:methionyl-tRNA formyltransferase